MPLFEPIVVSDLNTLREIVLAALSEYGPTVDLNPIHVGGVDRFDGLFKDTEFCGNVSQWDMGNARFANEMFSGTPFNGDLSKWNCTRLEETRGMFKDSLFNGDVNQWNVARMLRFEKNKGMFDTLHFSQDLTPWNIANVCETYRTNSLSALKKNTRLWLAIDGENQSKLATPQPGELRKESLKTYAKIFGGQARLQEYFSRAPFGVMHFDVCCANAMCPVGVSQEDFEWSRRIFSVGIGLGLDNAGLRALCASQLAARGEKEEIFSLDTVLGT